ncbi:thiamine-phosphate kinase [Thermoleptolyngbya sp. C42_A2020_037]|uniref:thiamine-phosphate kinase n=1 Tax=Thermoleptolyngbya sp. C42_A2020_037 TaxID=2747799 RepID=UPI0019DCC513|nr:thiamine-phosphate kinase [Thermoleptolyngbya sp. C42_A2020_037]MBF2083492.1 thiamine-phosphate kinase [Thermoleptolyngbya sp. C42_A2020_037]
MVSESLQVKHLGEQGLLSRIQTFCPAGMIGDDAALLTVSPGRSLVVTEDLLVDGVHFSVGLAAPGVITTSPADAGWRAVAANLSDLAAMGAAPLGITVGLGLPGDLPVDWIEQLYQGMTDCLSRFNTPIVGGDLCRSPVFTVAIAAFGEVDPSRVLRRSTAQPGDVIWVTGPHGASRAGLKLLIHPEQSEGLTEGDRAALIRAHQRPLPRLDVIPLLWACVEVGKRETHGKERSNLPPSPLTAMDSSDGLADAVLQICRASSVGAVLHRRQIPLPAGLLDWVGEPQAIAWALYGGEDFELVMCLPRAIAQALQAQLPGSAIVGDIVPGRDVILRDETGETPDETLSLDRGFQHFGD